MLTPTMEEVLSYESDVETIILLQDETLFLEQTEIEYFITIAEQLRSDVMLRVLYQSLFKFKNPRMELERIVQGFLDEKINVVLMTSSVFNGNSRDPIDLFFTYEDNPRFTYIQRVNSKENPDESDFKNGFYTIDKTTENLMELLMKLNLLRN